METYTKFVRKRTQIQPLLRYKQKCIFPLESTMLQKSRFYGEMVNVGNKPYLVLNHNFSSFEYVWSLTESLKLKIKILYGSLILNICVFSTIKFASYHENIEAK
jgi:hypothetical protein